MSNFSKWFSLIFALFSFNSLYPSDNPLIYQKGTVSLLNYTSVYLDVTAKKRFEEVSMLQSEEFVSLEDFSNRKIKPYKDTDYSYWLKIVLPGSFFDQHFQEPGELFLLVGRHDQITVYQENSIIPLFGGQLHKQSSGSDQFFFPITINKQAPTNVYAKIEDKNWIKDVFISEMFSLEDKIKYKEEFHDKNDFKFFLFSVLGIIVFLFVFFLVQYLQIWDKAYLFYLGYLICNLAYVIRVLDYKTDLVVIFSYLPTWTIYSLTTIGFFLNIFYLFFVFYFLDIFKHEGLKNIFKFLLKATVILYLIIIISFIWVPNEHQPFFAIQVPSITLLGIIIMTGYATTQIKSNVSKYIFIGSIFMIIGVMIDQLVSRFTSIGIAPYEFWGYGQVYSLGGMILELVFFSIGLGSRSKDIIKEKSEIKLNQVNSELLALQSQLNSHITFNCINSITKLIDEGKKTEASNYLALFSAFLRKVLDVSRRRTSTLESELTLSRFFLELSELLFKQPYTYKIIIKENVDVSDIRLPPLILQPYLENAIIYGLLNKRGEVWLKLIIEEDQESIKCIVDDNGIGMENSMKVKKYHQGIGRKLSKERIELFNEVHGTCWQINTIEKKDKLNNSMGTRIELTNKKINYENYNNR